MVKMRMVITVVVDCDYDDHAGDGGDNSGLLYGHTIDLWIIELKQKELKHQREQQ